MYKEILGMILVFIGITSVSAEGYYNGRIPDSVTIEVRVDDSKDAKYNNAWIDAYSYYNPQLEYRSFKRTTSAPSLMTVEFDYSRPNTFGRIIYQNSNTSYSTPFYTYLNEFKKEIFDSPNVRRSTASHELGHALGLADNSDSSSIMNTSRNRESLIYPTFTDIVMINNLK